MDGEKWTGVWTATVSGDIKNTYYTYSITAAHPVSKVVQTAETQDVYSVATGVNGRRSMVCDLYSTDPEGWNDDHHILLDKSTDSYVWELHVKDFSYDKASGVSDANRGKFTAFTEEGTLQPCSSTPSMTSSQSTKPAATSSSTGAMILRTTTFPKAHIQPTPTTATSESPNVSR